MSPGSREGRAVFSTLCARLAHRSDARSLPQVLDVVAPPYTSDFVQLFLPILENDSIAGTIKTEGEHDPVTEFIGRRLGVPLVQF